MRLTKLVAFVACAAATVSLHTAAAGAAAPAAATNTSGNIIFSGNDLGRGFTVWQVRPGRDGGARLSTWTHQSPSGREGYPRDVRYSPDGTKAAYAVDYDTDPTGPIIVRDVASGEILRTLDGMAAQAGAGLDWSPDGTRLVLVSQRSVQVLDLASGTLDPVYSRPRRYIMLSDVTWSPDGRWIAFATDDDVVNRIKSIHPDGTGGHTIISQPQQEGEFSALEWSPDSTRLAYIHTQRDIVTGAATTDLRTMDKKGETVVNVSALAGGPYVDRYFTDLAWSPDGVRIAASEQMTIPATNQYFARVRAYKADGSGKYWLTYDQTTTASTDFDWGGKLP